MNFIKRGERLSIQNKRVRQANSRVQDNRLLTIMSQRMARPIQNGQNSGEPVITLEAKDVTSLRKSLAESQN